MLKPLADSDRTREASRTYLIPASIKGWISNQSISRMDPEAAYELDNLFPEASMLRLRNGSQIWANLPDGKTVETVMSFLTGHNAKLFAATNGKIYDVTAGGTVSSPMLAGLQSNRWQYVNYANAANNWLLCVNGADAPMSYSAGSWQNLAISGPNNVNALSYIWEYQGTLFLIEGGTTNAWYLAPGAIQGAATQIPLGAMFEKGGSLVAGAQWTFASTYSLLNLCVFISSEGEVLIYQGNNPASASTWALVGHFVIGKPIGLRCLLNVNSDLVILCEDGLMPLSKALQYDRAAAAKQAFTWNIQDAFNDAYQQYGDNFGWQIFSFPLQHAALINIPKIENAESVQYVENVITGAWAQFTGLKAACWCVQQDALYFGNFDGNVWQANTGSADGLFPINASWISAFNDLEMPGRLKSASAVRVVFQADGEINPYVGVCCDFDIVAPPALASTIEAANSYWDVALWDIGVWDASEKPLAIWAAALGVGYQVAATVGLNVGGRDPTKPVTCKIVSAYVLFEPGALLG